jgi:hypothetical protein
MNLCGEVARAQHGCQQGLDRLAVTLLDLGLHLDLAFGLGAEPAFILAGQQTPILIGNRYAVGRHAGNGRGHQIDDRLHLAVSQRAAALQGQHDRGAGLGALA